jgi:hypothetical protein
LGEHDGWHTWSEPVHIEFGNYYVMDTGRHRSGHSDHHWYNAYQAVPASTDSQHNSVVDPALTGSNPLLSPITAEETHALEPVQKLEAVPAQDAPGFPTQSTYGQISEPKPNQSNEQPSGGWGVGNVPPDPAANIVAAPDQPANPGQDGR